jgi:hypothetical protein
MFFTKRPRNSPAAKEILTYDLRSGARFSVKTRPIADDDLKGFVTAYKVWTQLQKRRHARIPGAALATADFAPQCNVLSVEEVLSTRDANLDGSAAKSKTIEGAADRASLDRISQEIAEDLMRALAHVAAIGKMDISGKTNGR